MKRKSFPKFSELHDDLMMYILSFITNVPLEGRFDRHIGTRLRSTVTGALPLVCKKFHQFCQTDGFWKQSLRRMRLRDAYIWETGLKRLLPNGTLPDTDLVNQLQNLLHLDCKSIHRRVVDNLFRFAGPVYVILTKIWVGQTLELTLFELRHQLLISLVMEGWPKSARCGEPIRANASGAWPTFICVHPHGLRGMRGYLVHVRRCSVHPGRSANITIKVVARVQLDRIWEVPDSAQLSQATCFYPHEM